ncbi:GNAT family N-acetyltransferase [Rhizobium mongolense]
MGDDDDDSYLKIETCFSKHADAPEVLDFSIFLRRYVEHRDVPGPTLAHLKGFLVQPGYLPQPGDGWYFDVFDMRSQHAMNAFHVIADDRPLLKRALKTDFDYLSSVAHLDRVWVDPSLRKRGIALRLMREAQHVLGRYGLLVVLKAHPDGDNVTDADCLKLSAYYQSERQLGLRAVSKKKRPGWLVGVWDEPVINDADEVFLHLDVEVPTEPAEDE